MCTLFSARRHLHSLCLRYDVTCLELLPFSKSRLASIQKKMKQRRLVVRLDRQHAVFVRYHNTRERSEDLPAAIASGERQLVTLLINPIDGRTALARLYEPVVQMPGAPEYGVPKGTEAERPEECNFESQFLLCLSHLIAQYRGSFVENNTKSVSGF